MAAARVGVLTASVGVLPKVILRPTHIDVVGGRFIIVGIWIDTFVSAHDRHVSLLS
jgi:hypothetical protein